MSAETDDNTPELVPSQRRLQRPPDFTGGRLDSFHEVALRHGLPGCLLGVLCLLHPDMRALLAEALEPLTSQPGRYLAAGALMGAGLTAYAFSLDRKLDLPHIGWIAYLLMVSLWEEWVFRLALPYFAEAEGAALPVAVIASNLVFGALHYFTLRWKWQWCVGAFVFGLLMSRQLDRQFDLALVIGIHWIGTFLNTPRLPGQPRGRRQPRGQSRVPE